MDASTVARRAILSDSAAQSPAQFIASLVRLLSVAPIALVALAGAVVWLRRATGSLSVPLPASALIATAAALLLTAAIYRAGRHAQGLVDRPFEPLILTTLVTVLVAAAVSIAGSPPIGLAAMWFVVVTEEAAAWGVAWRRGRGGPPGPATGRLGLGEGDSPIFLPGHRKIGTVPSGIETSSIDDPLDDAIEDPLADPAASQYFVRRRDEQGGETISGWVRAEFAASQRHATAHVAICPPLDRVPECYAELGEGPTGEVKIGQFLPWGVRLDIKLDEPTTEPTKVLIEFSIQGGSLHSSEQ